MNDANGEKISREELISYAQELSLKEYSGLLKGLFVAIAVIDPLEEEICFSDGMSSLLGLAAGSFMYLSQFYHNIPESERAAASAAYENAFGDLLERDIQDAVITHRLLCQDMDIRDIEVRMKLQTIGRSRFVLSVLADVTPSSGTRACRALFGPDIDSYIFMYDIRDDVCRVSDRFIRDFDLKSGDIAGFSEQYRQFVHPDDAEMIRALLVNYVQTGEPDLGADVRFLAPGRGELNLRLDGLSDHGNEGRFVSGIFTDVTDYVNAEILRRNTIEGMGEVLFVTDLNRNITEFTGGIQDLIDDLDDRASGDVVELFMPYIVSADRQRLRNVLNHSVRELGTRFSVEVRLKGRMDKPVWIAIRGKSFENRKTMARTVSGSIINLTKLNEVKDSFEKAGASDELTGLPTGPRLERDLEIVIRDRNITCAAVIMFDITDFHEITDRYGKKTGDRILLNLRDKLNALMPQKASLYHIGTDNFAVLWPETSQLKANDLMSSVIAVSEEPIEDDKGKFFISLIGSAAFYPEGRSASELINQAEITLHKVKENKTIRYAVFSPSDRNELKEKLDFQMTISSDINNGFENFMLYYQPLTNARTGILEGAEALLRWMKPSGEPENPEKVVAALEANDQMAQVGQWILNEAIRQCAEWISKGAPGDFYVHINATADDLITEDYVSRVKAALERHKLPPENILIELTESSVLKDMATCRKNIELLHENNIRTALDDFGSGYSSFDYLKELPVDEIKIDKMFVDDMLTNKFDNTFISAMTMLAHSIGKGVVVEGVENEQQYLMLRDMDADVIQGYYFDRPLSVFAFWNKYFS